MKLIVNNGKLALTTLAFCLAMSGCKQAGEGLLGTDIGLFKGVAWELAQAVEGQDTVKIKQIIISHKISVNYQEPKFGETLLEWAVWTNHYKSAKSLLENGADPNLQDYADGYSAFTYAANKFETSAYVRLILNYKGNPNALAKNDSTSMYPTPLISAAYHRLESVKLLVDAGADINYMAKNYKCALAAAFAFKKVDIVHYLLIDKGADFQKPFGRTIDGRDIMITNLLRNWIFPLNSEKYEEKMEIVKYLKDKGMDYRETPIPEHYYKLYSKEFLNKY
jgi:ankyrin repeat protein